jgi:hypothetical protein
MQSSIPSFDVGLESEEGGLHSCCVRRRNSEVLRSLLRAPEPLDRDDQKKIIKAIADEQVSVILTPCFSTMPILPASLAVKSTIPSTVLQCIFVCLFTSNLALQEQQQAFAGQLLRGVIALVLLLHGYLLLQQTLRPWSTKLLAHFYSTIILLYIIIHF